MKSALLSIVSATVFVAGVFAQSSLSINTPANAATCEPLLLSWGGGTGPYFLTVHDGNSPDTAALLDLGQQNSTSFTLAALAFPSGTSLDLTIRDSTGTTAQSAPFTVQAGVSTACLNTTTPGSGSAPAAASTTSAAGTTPAGTTSSSIPTTTATTPKGTSSTSKSGSSSSTSSPASTTNAAMPIGVSYAVAGVLGGIVAAVLA